MPFKSQAQRRKVAQLMVAGKISPETFEEWNRETGGAELPERVKPKRAPKKGKKRTAKRAANRRPAKKAATKRPAKRAARKTASKAPKKRSARRRSGKD